MHLVRPGRRVRALWLPRADRALVQWSHDLPELHARGHASALWTGDEALDIARVAVAPNGESFVHPSANLTRVNVVHVEDGASSGVSATPTIEALAYAPDSLSVLWSTYAPPYDFGEVESWELGAPASTTVDTETGRTTGVGFSRDATCALVAFGARVAAYLRGETWERIASHDVGIHVVELVPLRDGLEVVALSAYGEAAILDVVSGAVRWRAGGGREATSVQVHPLGHSMVWTPRHPSRTDARPLVVRRVGEDVTIEVPASAFGAWCEARWVGATEQLAVRTATEVFVFDLNDGTAQLRSTWTSPAGELTALAASADGAIACGTERGDVFVL